MSMSSVLGKDWVSKTYNEESVNFLKDNLNLSEITSKLIAIRKIKVADVNLFLKPKIKNLIPDPFILKDMEKAVSRTVESIQKKNKIGIFGDYDVDGATSSALLGNFFKSINQDVEIKAEKGLTVFWPTEWTHTHVGVVSPTETKYIITGWYNYND